jgi:pimeloyl-ACP methyl ester carboxylesterase
VEHEIQIAVAVHYAMIARREEDFRRLERGYRERVSRIISLSSMLTCPLTVADFFGTRANPSDLAGEIEAPVRVIHSQNDLTVPPSTGRRLASLIPDARLRIVEGYHAPWTPQVFEAISDFLAEEQPGPSGSGVE